MDERTTEITVSVFELHTAAQAGDINAIKDYLDAGGDIEVLDTEKHIALYVAVEYRQWAVVEFLLANNANSFYPGTSGDTFLHHILRRTDCVEHLSDCWQHLTIPQQEELLQTANTYGYYPLHEIAARGCVEFIAWFITASSNAYSIDWNILTCGSLPGFTPLQLAAMKKHMPMIKQLLRQGADPFVLTEHITQCNSSERIYWLSCLQSIAEDPQAHCPLLTLFLEFMRLRFTSDTSPSPLPQEAKSPRLPAGDLVVNTSLLEKLQHGYLQCLKQLSPHATAIAPVVLAISEALTSAQTIISTPYVTPPLPCIIRERLLLNRSPIGRH
jgi:ankyrin repeat protein